MTRSKFAGLMATPPKTAARRPRTADAVSRPGVRRREGRSSNPAQFRQMLIYVDVPTLDAFKVQLAQEKRQASDVIPKLMQLWLATPRPKYLNI